MTFLLMVRLIPGASEGGAPPVTVSGVGYYMRRRRRLR